MLTVLRSAHGPSQKVTHIEGNPGFRRCSQYAVCSGAEGDFAEMEYLLLVAGYTVYKRNRCSSRQYTAGLITKR